MDISQETDQKSQDMIPVRPSFGKNFECYVREGVIENPCSRIPEATLKRLRRGEGNPPGGGTPIIFG